MKQQVLLTKTKNLCEKIEAHKKGIQHYAFSIVILNNKGEMLLQKRAYSKYHCGGLWSNACCGHPLSVESITDIEDSACKRLLEEIGISVSLNFLFTFEYNAQCGNLTENERDFVFIGQYNNPQVFPNHREVSDYRWTPVADIIMDVKSTPHIYTPWFRILISNFTTYNKTN